MDTGARAAGAARANSAKASGLAGGRGGAGWPLVDQLQVVVGKALVDQLASCSWYQMAEAIYEYL